MLRHRFGRLLAVVILAGLQQFVVQDRLVQAATLEWVRQFGTSSNDLGTTISADRLGNVFVAGRTRGNLGGLNAGGDDAFVRKYDAAGNVHWTTQVGTTSGDTAYAISADGFGNAYVACTTYLGSNASPSVPAVNAFLAKLNVDGSVAWSRQLGDDLYREIRGVSADGLGNVYVAGHRRILNPYSTAGQFEVFLTKYDAIGNSVWTRQFGSDKDDWCNSVSADAHGNVFVGGTSEVIGETPFLSRFDSDGNQQWTQYYNGNDLNQGFSVSADGKGNVYFAAVGGGLGLITKPIITSIGKFDGSGALQWSRETEATYNGFHTLIFGSTLDVSADGAGNVYLSGIIENQVSSFEMYLTKYDELGNHVWSEQLASAALDASPSVATDGLGNVYIGGYTAGDLSGTNLGGYDAVVAKFSDPPVPEPASWQLLTIFFMAWWCHRRSV